MEEIGGLTAFGIFFWESRRRSILLRSGGEVLFLREQKERCSFEEKVRSILLRSEGEVFFWQIRRRSILPKGHQLWLCLDSPIQLKVHDDFDQWLFNQLQWLIGDSQVTLDVWANTIYGTNNKRNWPNLCGFETPCQFGAILWLLPSLS